MAPGQSPQGRPFGPPDGLDRINLADHGLSDGDDLSEYLDDHASSGVDVVIPAGSYTMSNIDALEVGPDASIRCPEGYADIGSDHDSGRSIYSHDSGKVYIEGFRFTEPWTNTKVPNFTAEMGDDGEVEFNRLILRDDGSGERSRGFYTSREHSGHLTVRNCDVRGMTDNAIYASSPGKVHDGGGDGSTWALGGYYQDNSVSCVRLGGSNSRAEHIRIVYDGTTPSNNGNGIRIRDQGEGIVVHDIHELYDGAGADPVVIHGKIHECRGSTHLQDVYIEYHNDNDAIAYDCSGYDLTGDNVHVSGDGNLDVGGPSGAYSNLHVGDEADAPRSDPVFVTADGEVINADGDMIGDPDTDPEPEPTPDPGEEHDHHLVFETFEGDDVTAYEFVVEGAEPVPGVDAAGEQGTNVTDNGDGTYTATGRTGNGFTDDWHYTGVIQSFEAVIEASGEPAAYGERYALHLDGEEITHDALVEGGAGDEEPPADEPDDGTDEPDDGTDDGTDDSGGETDTMTEADVIALIEEHGLSEANVRALAADEISKRLQE